ncbi:MAG: HEAT repeat domain-containing protein [Oligoflexus sp.]|nr:HEAT repeat domain-containing protein [Pseudopedobacter sp.]
MLVNYFNLSGAQFLVGLTILFCGFIILLISFIAISLFILNKRELNYYDWKELADDLITMAIFFEPDELDPSNISGVEISPKIKELLPNKHFRTIFTNQLLSAKENVTGSSGDNLNHLYTQLGLEIFALKKIRSKSWHKIAKGIKELGIMDLKKYLIDIEPFLNYKKNLIRIEAQNTILKFKGFQGLRFLDTASYPISEWHQLKLLEELAQLPPDDFTGIGNWLNSTNDSVVLFALKLVRNYHLFQFHQQLTQLFSHQNEDIRLHAIISIKEIPDETTANSLIKIYKKETINIKLEILIALKQLAMEDEIPFIVSCLDDNLTDIKFAAATTLYHIKPNGFKHVLVHSDADKEPLVKIIKHLQSNIK